MVDLFPALQGVKTIMDSLNAISSMREENRRIDAILGVKRQLLELQRDLEEAFAEKVALTDEVRTLKEELGRLKQTTSDLDRYELKNIGGGSSAYMLKADARGTEAPRWLCPVCYDNGKKSQYQFSVRSSRGNVYRCATCSGQTMVPGEPTWLK